MKKVLIAGVGAMLLAGGFYGISNVSAASGNQPAKVEAKAGHAGKRLEALSKNTDQVHQVNQLREERLDLKKQMIEKKDQLLDLLIAAKKSGDKEKIQLAKEVRKQLKGLNEELNTLAGTVKDSRKALKEALKNGEGSEQFTQLITAQQQVNEKMKGKLAGLDKLIEILK